MRAYKCNGFQKRHYEQIAALLKAERPGEHWDANKRMQWQLIVNSFTRLFASDNCRFQGDRFVDACGGSFDI